MRFETPWSTATARLAVGARRIETAQGERETVAPVAWAAARVEAWLDWADAVPTDYPIGDYPTGDLPSVLSPEAPNDPLLAGGPARYARRLAAWGMRLGHFQDCGEAEAFADALFGLYACGLAAPGASLAFGARLHPLTPDPACGPVERRRHVEASEAWAARSDGPLPRRLAAVSDAVRRCHGDPDACADPDANQALARGSAWEAHEEGGGG